jgi:hypothetical protein
MRRPVNWLAVSVAAALVMGCIPETSNPPPMEPVEAEVSPSPTPKGGARPALKVRKPPGLGSATPKTSTAPPSTR